MSEFFVDEGVILGLKSLVEVTDLKEEELKNEKELQKLAKIQVQQRILEEFYKGLVYFERKGICTHEIKDERVNEKETQVLLTSEISLDYKAEFKAVKNEGEEEALNNMSDLLAFIIVTFDDKDFRDDLLALISKYTSS